MHRVKEFTLRDVNGKDHAYRCETHTADEGMPIAWALMRAGIPSAVSAAAVAFGSEGAPVPDLAGSVATSLAATDGPKLARQILARTWRENDDGKSVKLDGDGIADAYAGNYPELYEAVVEVVLHNRFLPSLNQLLARLPKPEAKPTPS